jgi:hypothetical protein
VNLWCAFKSTNVMDTFTETLMYNRECQKLISTTTSRMCYLPARRKKCAFQLNFWICIGYREPNFLVPKSILVATRYLKNKVHSSSNITKMVRRKNAESHRYVSGKIKG